MARRQSGPRIRTDEKSGALLARENPNQWIMGDNKANFHGTNGPLHFSIVADNEMVMWQAFSDDDSHIPSEYEVCAGFQTAFARAQQIASELNEQEVL